MKSIRIPSEKQEKMILKEQIQYERDILAKVKHPFIAQLKYAFKTQNRFFLVMPYYQGGELLGYLKTEKRRREEFTVFFAAQIAMALHYLHSLGIIYGDLKPGNILMDKYGYIRLTDFGASKFLNGKDSIMGFAGTPDYLAPEVLRNKQITKASDWWAFGILVYEMLFGRSPFFNMNS